jgi:hypothetical protein
VPQDPEAPANQRPIEPPAVGICEEIDQDEEEVYGDVDRKMDDESAVVKDAMHCGRPGLALIIIFVEFKLVQC